MLLCQCDMKVYIPTSNNHVQESGIIFWNVGECSEGVCVCRSEESLITMLSANKARCI